MIYNIRKLYLRHTIFNNILVDPLTSFKYRSGSSERSYERYSNRRRKLGTDLGSTVGFQAYGGSGDLCPDSEGRHLKNKLLV